MKRRSFFAVISSLAVFAFGATKASSMTPCGANRNGDIVPLNELDYLRMSDEMRALRSVSEKYGYTWVHTAFSSELSVDDLDMKLGFPSGTWRKRGMVIGGYWFWLQPLEHGHCDK